MSTTYNEIVTAPVAGAPALRAWNWVSWPAIFAGIVLVLGVEILLNMLGAGVGLGIINPGTSGTPSVGSFGMGAGIWWIISTIIALLFGCYAAARLARVSHRWDGVLHGLVIWAGVVLITVYLISSAIGGVIGGAFSVVGGTISGAGSAVGGAASGAGSIVQAALPELAGSGGLNPNVLRQQAESLLGAPAPQNPADMNHAQAVAAIGNALPALMAGGAKGAAAKTEISNIIAAQTHISPQDAQNRIANVQTRLAEITTQAVRTGAATASRGALLAFAALLIGAIAAAIGGALASPRGKLLARETAPVAVETTL